MHTSRAIQRQSGAMSVQSPNARGRGAGLSEALRGSDFATGEAMLQPHDTDAPPTTRVVQAKLAGAAQVLESRGDEVSSSGKRNKSDWYKLVRDMGAYEQAEARFIAFLRNNDARAAKPIAAETGAQLVEQLRGVEGRMDAFMNDKAHAKVIAKADELVEGNVEGQSEAPEIKGKNRPKAAKEKDNSIVRRAEAIRQLQPRVRVEREDLQSTVAAANSQRWPQELGRFAADLDVFNDEVATDVEDNAVGGQMNRLDKMKMNGKEGYFARGRARGLDNTHGISKTDANSAGRSVAMFRLAKLLGIGERIVTTTFATHTRTNQQGKTTTESGVFSEKAKGREMREQVEEGTVDIASPLVQVAMNQIQMLDMLCAQVDRHGGNFFFDPESGEIKGIDNDMSFGKNITTLLGGSRQQAGDAETNEGKMKGLPTLVDAKLAATLMELDPQLVRDALKGLLEQAEIDSTVLRLQEIKTHLAKPEVRRLSEQEWDEGTAIEQLSKNKSSMLETVAFSAGVSSPEFRATNNARGTFDRLSEVALLKFLYSRGKIPQGGLGEFVAQVDVLTRPQFQKPEYKAIEYNARKVRMEEIYTDAIKRVAGARGML